MVPVSSMVSLIICLRIVGQMPAWYSNYWIMTRRTKI
jgi:hypothetical protein